MEIKCEFRMVTADYVAIVKESSITEPDTVVKSVNGIHVPGKSNDDVTYVYFRSKEVAYFPSGLGQIFPNLARLVIKNCGLKKISQKDLVGLETLESLYCPQNQLTLLPDDLFVGMRNLQFIDLTDNRIVFVSSQAFAGIANQLKSIELQRNPCINVQYEEPSSIEEFFNAVDESGIKPVNEMSHQDCLTAASKDMWVTGKYSDFTINVEGKIFHVHKAILGSLSPVLASAIDQPMQEAKNGRMIIEDFNADAVRDFLHFIYTGKCNEKNAMDLFAIAAKYQVSALKLICEKIVVENTENENALEVLYLGNLYDSEAMKLIAFTVIQKTLDFEIPSNLKDNPDKLNAIIKAKEWRKKKIAEIEEEFNKSSKEIQIKQQKEIEAMEKEYNEILKENQ